MLITKPPETHEAAREAWQDAIDAAFAEVFRAKPYLTVSQWAERYRVLSSETSAEPGPWRNERTPYLVEIMDALSDPEVTEMVIMKSARIGYTEGVIGNGLGYFIDQDPCPVLVLQPAEGDAEDWSKKQLTPLIRDCAVLAEKFPPPGTRDSANTILDKAFPGGSVTIRGAHSPRGLRRLTIRVCFMDEISGFQLSAGAEGDPVLLAEMRTATFPNRKNVKGSTPVDLAHCRITKDFARSDQRHWHVPCPHCAHEQVLRWGGPDKPFGIKWDREVRCKRCTHVLGADDERCPTCKGTEREVKHLPETAYYLCEQCATPIGEFEKERMVRAGRYIAAKPEAPVPGWHVNALVSLISDKARWPNLVKEWLDAQSDSMRLQVFVNTVLGEPWEEKGKKLAVGELESRAEQWLNPITGEPADVPEGVGMLTAFVDVQLDRLEVLVRGFGAKEESWGVLHQRIYGDPESPQTWAQLETIRTKAYVHQRGATMRIQTMLVDAGYATDAVYAYVRSRESQGVYGSVGRAGEGKPPLSRASKADKDKTKLFTIGVDTLKDRLFSQLGLSRPGPRYMHFPVQDPDRFNGFDAEFYAQFGREKKVPKRRKGNARGGKEWVKTGRNEAIDLEVGCIAALYVSSPGRRAELGRLAAQITKRGEAHKETLIAPKRARKVRSRGVR